MCLSLVGNVWTCRTFHVSAKSHVISAAKNLFKVMTVMTAWPTKNHHTDITSVMCARTGQMKTVVWAHENFGQILV